VPFIRFTLQVDTEDLEPSRVVPRIEGRIFSYADTNAAEEETEVGTIVAFLVLESRAVNEKISLFEAMDSTSQILCECYESIYDPDTEDWSLAVEELYNSHVPIFHDTLFIEDVQIEPSQQDKAKMAATAIRGAVETFASSCGLIVCPAEISGSDQDWVTSDFWKSLDFVKLGDTGFYVRAPERLQQPDPDAPRQEAPRVLRGRRRLRAKPRR
jgi:hypothetical protein